MCNRAVVTAFLRAFLCCMLAGKTKHYNTKVVNYSSDGGQSCQKGQRVSTKSVSSSIVCLQLGQQKLSIIQTSVCYCVIQSSEVSAIQGLLKY